MAILHILQGTKEESISKVINLESVKEVSTEYKEEVTAFDDEKEEIEHKAEMTISYANTDQETKIDVDDSNPAIFRIIDNLGEEYIKTSNVVNAEKAIMQIMAVKNFELIEDDSEAEVEEVEATK